MDEGVRERDSCSCVCFLELDGAIGGIARR